MSTSSSAKPSSACSPRTCSSARSHRWQPSAWKTTTLGIQATRGGGLGDALHREAVRGDAHRQLAPLGEVPGLVESAAHDVVQLRVHLGLLPEVLLEALHPFEVRDDDAAGVREHVRQDEHALVLEDLVGLGGHWA